MDPKAVPTLEQSADNNQPSLDSSNSDELSQLSFKSYERYWCFGNGKSSLRVASAWARRQRLFWGQAATPEKSKL